jgi:hypothetical protein
MDWTTFDGFLSQDILQYTKTVSASGQSESETATIGGVDDGVLWEAEDDTLSSQRRRKARMSEVDEATQLVSNPVRSHVDRVVILPHPASTSAKPRIPAGLPPT